jgi:hypothetical protein
MKILLIAKGRCGSHSLMDWLSNEFNLVKMYENGDVDISILDDYILKRHPSLDLITDGYDYVIRLIRENTILTSESNVWAQEKQKYHPVDNEKYIIDEDFLINNHEEIWNKKIGYDEFNNTISNINAGLLVTYEEMFIYGTGQEKIENYMGFKSNSKLNTDDKKGRLHVMDKTQHTTYDIEYKKIIHMLKEKENIINNKNIMLKEKENIINNKNIMIKNLISSMPKRII